MNDTQQQGMAIGVGVAVFGQDEHLARTLEAAGAALHEAGVLPVARVVAIGDGSATAERIANEHGWSARRAMTGSPRTRAAAREAARRAAGGEACLLIDGDVALATGWLTRAMVRLSENPALGGVGGAIDEAHWRAGALVGSGRDVDRVGAGGPASRLRDVALWRRSAVDSAGGFDVWLPGEDDVELVARLVLGGARVETLRATAGARHGTARWSFGDWLLALRSGALAGPGMALRRAQGTLMFGRLFARYRGAIAILAWFVVGAVLAIASRAGGPFVVWIWATIAALAFASVMAWSLSRAFFGGLTALAQGIFIARQLALPIGRARLGTPPRPIAPPRESAASEATASGAMVEVANPFEASLPREPDEPPPLVGGR